jgi:hypothetical protein
MESDATILSKLCENASLRYAKFVERSGLQREPEAPSRLEIRLLLRSFQGCSRHRIESIYGMGLPSHVPPSNPPAGVSRRQWRVTCNRDWANTTDPSRYVHISCDEIPMEDQ